jgi:hypothetical protein
VGRRHTPGRTSGFGSGATCACSAVSVRRARCVSGRRACGTPWRGSRPRSSRLGRAPGRPGRRSRVPARGSRVSPASPLAGAGRFCQVMDMLDGHQDPRTHRRGDSAGIATRSSSPPPACNVAPDGSRQAARFCPMGSTARISRTAQPAPSKHGVDMDSWRQDAPAIPRGDCRCVTRSEPNSSSRYPTWPAGARGDVRRVAALDTR